MNFLYAATPTGDLENNPQQLNFSGAEKDLLDHLLEELKSHQLSRLDLQLAAGQVIFLTAADGQKPSS